MTLEYRTAVGGEFKDLDEVKRQVLVEFPHDVVDTYKTTFGNECFVDSFAKRAPRMVWMHEMREPIGHAISAQVTKRANELVGQLDSFEDVPLAKRAFSQIASGTITDFSHGFMRQAEEPHPEHRGVTRITRAVMQEISPVVLGSIPGAIATGLRSAGDEPDTTLHPPTIAEIEHLFQANLLDREEARALLADLPEYRMRIVLGGTLADPVVEIATTEPAASAQEPAEARDAGSPPMVPVAPASDDSDEDEDDVATLAASVDAALDSAVYWLSKSSADDLAGLPDNIQQAVALVGAAGVVADDLLVALGVEDPDDPDEMEGSGDDSGRSVEAPEVAEEAEGTPPEAREDPEAEVEERALSDKKWDPKPADYTLAQWKAACLIWSGPNDEVGSGSLPVLEPNGDPNRAGMAAAAARLNQVDAPEAAKQAAAKKLLGLYGSNKLHAPGSLLQAARSVEDPEVRALVADAVDGELDALFGRLGVEAA